MTNFVFLVIFDTCDVMYNWSISLLPPIVLDNLFAETCCFHINVDLQYWDEINLQGETLNGNKTFPFLFLFGLTNALLYKNREKIKK